LFWIIVAKELLFWAQRLVDAASVSAASTRSFDERLLPIGVECWAWECSSLGFGRARWVSIELRSASQECQYSAGGLVPSMWGESATGGA